MKLEDQRIAIAEACGKLGAVPDYPNDLNAMHGAEEFFIKKRSHKYQFSAELYKVCAGINLASGINSPEAVWNVSHATAAQRAEAFLRTLGLWKEAA